jgi:hypothetical protein
LIAEYSEKAGYEVIAAVTESAIGPKAAGVVVFLGGKRWHCITEREIAIERSGRSAGLAEAPLDELRGIARDRKRVAACRTRLAPQRCEKCAEEARRRARDEFEKNIRPEVSDVDDDRNSMTPTVSSCCSRQFQRR